MVCNLLLQGLLKFDKIHVFSPSIEQPKYLMLKDLYEKLDERKEAAMRQKIARLNSRPGRKKKYTMPEMEPTATFDTSPDGFKLDSLKEDQTTLIVLDDLMLHPQGSMINLFSRGRHKGISLIYMAQSYYAIPKVIRQNCSAFAIFAPTTKREIVLLRQDIGPGVEEDVFTETLKHILKIQYNFFFVDLLAKDPAKMFRLKFDTCLFPDRFDTNR